MTPSVLATSSFCQKTPRGGSGRGHVLENPAGYTVKHESMQVVYSSKIETQFSSVVVASESIHSAQQHR